MQCRFKHFQPLYQKQSLFPDERISGEEAEQGWNPEPDISE
jgi:hypothetical protein